MKAKFEIDTDMKHDDMIVEWDQPDTETVNAIRTAADKNRRSIRTGIHGNEVAKVVSDQQ